MFGSTSTNAGIRSFFTRPTDVPKVNAGVITSDPFLNLNASTPCKADDPGLHIGSASC